MPLCVSRCRAYRATQLYIVTHLTLRRGNISLRQWSRATFPSRFRARAHVLSRTRISPSIYFAFLSYHLDLAPASTDSSEANSLSRLPPVPLPLLQVSSPLRKHSKLVSRSYKTLPWLRDFDIPVCPLFLRAWSCIFVSRYHASVARMIGLGK